MRNMPSTSPKPSNKSRYDNKRAPAYRAIPLRICLLSYVVLLPFGSVIQLGAVGVAPSSAVAQFTAALTNFPPLADVILETKFVPADKPTYYHFRYQADGFLARVLRNLNDGFDITRVSTLKACGNWKSEYWYLEGIPGAMQGRMKLKPVVHTYTYDSSDTNSTAYMNNRLFKEWFSYFATFGISPHGVNSMQARGDCFRSVEPERAIEVLFCPSELSLSNGIPVAAKVHRSARGIPLPDMIVYYEYHPERVPYPIPSRIRANEVLSGKEEFSFTIEVIQLALASSTNALEREHFIPPSTTWGTNVSQIIYTNRANRFQRGGQLVDIPQTPIEAQAALHRFNHIPRRYVVWGLILTISLPVLIMVIRNRREGRDHK